MQASEPTPEPTSTPDDSNIPYFPDYFGGTVTLILAQIVFYAFFLVFAIKLVKWGGRAWLMSKRFLVDKEVVVNSYKEGSNDSVYVGWVDQKWSTYRRAFRDWCWPPKSIAPTPFQNWIERTAQQVDEALDNYRGYYESPDEAINPLLSAIDVAISGISEAMDNSLTGKSLLERLGADKKAISAISEIRDNLRSHNSQIRKILTNDKFSDEQKKEWCKLNLSIVSHVPTSLRFIAYSRSVTLGEIKDFDVDTDKL